MLTNVNIDKRAKASPERFTFPVRIRRSPIQIPIIDGMRSTTIAPRYLLHRIVNRETLLEQTNANVPRSFSLQMAS